MADIRGELRTELGFARAVQKMHDAVMLEAHQALHADDIDQITVVLEKLRACNDLIKSVQSQ